MNTRFLFLPLLALCFSFFAFACVDREERSLPSIEPEPNTNNRIVEPEPEVRLLSDYAPVEPIRLLTDEEGIPHVYAQNDLDLMYGAGYQLAKERLFELDINRRKALGLMAKVYGRSKISADYQARALGFARHHKASLDAMAKKYPSDHNLLIAYVAGINARTKEVRSGQAPLPDRFVRHDYRPDYFKPEDILAIGLRINFGYSSQLEYDLLNAILYKLAPDIASDIPIHQPGDPTFTTRLEDALPMSARKSVFSPFEPVERPTLTAAQLESFQSMVKAIRTFRVNRGYSEGSNAWIVNGDHTFNGRPIVANDSHSSLRNPNDLYLMHLNSKDAGGAFDVMGFGFIGVPGIQLGHNRDLAWAATTHFADTMDLFDVYLNKKTMTATFGTVDHPVAKYVELIEVRGEDAPEQFEVMAIPGKGVFLPDEMLSFGEGEATLMAKGLLTGRELFLEFPGYGPTDELSMFFNLDRAKTLDDFDAAIDLQKTGMQNWHGATKDGMRYRTSGLVPVRGSGNGRATPNRLMDATNLDHVWSGQYLPKSILPKLDGNQRYHISANNDPFGHTADNNPLNDDFYYASFYSAGYRIGLLNRALDAQIAAGKITIEQTKTLQMDVHSALADRMLPILKAAADKIDTEERLVAYRERQDIKDALLLLDGWDRQMTKDSRAALIHRVWLEYLGRAVLADDMARLFDPIYDEQPIIILKLLVLIYEQQLTRFFTAAVDGASGDLAMLDALAQALDLIEQRGWSTWGEVHRARFISHDDATERLHPTGGDGSTINVAQSRCWDGKNNTFANRCTSNGGAVFRTVTSFEDDGTPSTIFNFAAGNGATLQDWLEGNYKPWRFKTTDVEASAAERVVVLNPN